MIPALSDQSIIIVVTAAAMLAFWAIWLAVTWRPPMEARLKALRTRRMKTRSEQITTARSSPKVASIGFMRNIASRLNLLRGAAADQTTRKLRLAGFHSRDAAVIYTFVKLTLP